MRGPFAKYHEPYAEYCLRTTLSAAELAAAKKDPDRYKSLRGRVSGFSAVFVNLKEPLQENILARTVRGL